MRMDQQAQAFNAQQEQAQRQIEAQQRQIKALQQQKQNAPPQHEDLTEKLKKYADLKQQGILTEKEFQKLKTDLLSRI
jgi:multidrug resistance efflux pump